MEPTKTQTLFTTYINEYSNNLSSPTKTERNIEIVADIANKIVECSWSEYLLKENIEVLKPSQELLNNVLAEVVIKLFANKDEKARICKNFITIVDELLISGSQITDRTETLLHSILQKETLKQTIYQRSVLQEEYAVI